MKNNPIRIRARPDRLCRRGHHGFYFDLLGIFLCLTQAIALVGKERDSFPDWKLKGTLAGLADSNPSVRALAAEALGEGGTTVLPRIADVMKHDGDELVRAAAAKALATARAYGYTDDIAVMVDDPNWEVKVAAAEALGVLHNQPTVSVPALGKLLSDKKDPGNVISAALKSLPQFGAAMLKFTQTGKRPARCPVCGAAGVPLVHAHLVPRSEGGSASADNTFWLCANCHAQMDQGQVREFEFEATLAHLMRVSQQFEENTVAEQAPLSGADRFNRVDILAVEIKTHQKVIIECKTAFSWHGFANARIRIPRQICRGLIEARATTGRVPPALAIQLANALPQICRTCPVAETEQGRPTVGYSAQ